MNVKPRPINQVTSSSNQSVGLVHATPTIPKIETQETEPSPPESTPIGSPTTTSTQISPKFSPAPTTFREAPFRKIFSNDYSKTIKRPDSVHGVKIPDDNLQPSGTVFIRQFINVQVSGDGTVGVMLGSNIGAGTGSALVPDSAGCNFGNIPIATGVVGGYTGTGALKTAPFSVAATAAGINPIISPLVTYFGQYFTMSRLVSMKLTAFPTAAANNNSGFFACASLAKGAFRDNVAANLATTDLLNLPNVYTQPVIEGGVSCIYRPTDNTCIEYSHLADSTVDPDYDQGSLFIVGSGLATGTSVLFQIDANYEFLPQQGYMMMGVTSSFVDREALDEAFNDCQNLSGSGKTEEDHVDSHSSLMSVTNGGNVGVFLGTTSQTTGRTLVTTITKSRGRNPKTSARSREPRTMFQQLGDFVFNMASQVAPKLIASLL